MKRLEDVLRRQTQGNAVPSVDPTAGSSIDARAKEPETPACPYCGGAGFVRRQVPVGDPDFGRAVPCACSLEETDAERQIRLRRYSNLGALGRYTFTQLAPLAPLGPARQQHYEQVVRLARGFAEEPEGWLVLLGASGSGKTHLAAAIASDVVARGRPVLFMMVPDLLDHLRAAFAPEAEAAYDRLFEQVRNAPLLILDDFGIQTPTPWAEEKVHQLVNHRFNLTLPTVFAVAGRLDALDDRLRNRLTDPSLARVIQLEAGAASDVGESDALALPLLAEMTFQSFSYRPTGPDLPDQAARKLQQAYLSARNFALRPEGWLVLAGETGCGKTHLAAAVAHQQRASGRQYLFVAVPDLLDRLREDVRSSRPREGQDLFERVRTCPFLVLDDLGVHSDTAWAQEKLFQILNYRYNAKLPTVITVRPSDELPAAVRSRLYDDKVSLFVEIVAPDYRNPERPRGAAARRSRQSRQ